MKDFVDVSVPEKVTGSELVPETLREMDLVGLNESVDVTVEELEVVNDPDAVVDDVSPTLLLSVSEAEDENEPEPVPLSLPVTSDAEGEGEPDSVR